MKTSFSFSSMFAICGLIAFLAISCGGPDSRQEKTPQVAERVTEILRVSVLLTEKTISEDAWTTLINRFAEGKEDFEIKINLISVEPAAGFEEIAKHIEGSDAVIFPSPLIQTFRDHSGSFYPIATDDLEIPELMGQLYATSRAGQSWGLPFMVDPIVLAIKKEACNRIGEYKFPTSWNMVSHIVNTFSDEDHPYPHLRINGQNPFGWSDTLATYFLSLGIDYANLIGGKNDPSMTALELLDRNRISFPGFIEFFTGSEELKPFSDPSVSQLHKFIESDSAMIFARVSELAALSSSSMDLIYCGIPPHITENPILVSYVYSSAVQIDAKNPAKADEFSKFLSRLNRNAEDSKFNLSVGQKLNAISINLNLDTSVIVPRINAETIKQEEIAAFAEEKMETLEFKKQWQKGYYIPQISEISL